MKYPRFFGSAEHLSASFLSKQADQIRTCSQPMSPLPVPQDINAMIRKQIAGAPHRKTVQPPVRAVLFDIYGTLVQSGSGEIGTAGDPSDAHQSVEPPPIYQKAIESGFDPEKAFTSAVKNEHETGRQAGRPFPEVDALSLWETLLKPFGATREDAADSLLYRELTGNPCWPMPEATPLLRELSDRGIPLGIVSNAQYYTRLLFPSLFGKEIEELGFNDPELLSWSYALLRGKPDPLLFEHPVRTLEKKGIHPEEILYVGNDRRNDIATAAACGLQTALFAGDNRSLRPRFGDKIAGDFWPDHLCGNLISLINLL